LEYQCHGTQVVKHNRWKQNAFVLFSESCQPSRDKDTHGAEAYLREILAEQLTGFGGLMLVWATNPPPRTGRPRLDVPSRNARSASEKEHREGAGM